MTTATIPTTNREQWLATRAQDVTSTEVAALYGLSPYMTEFELWHRKRDHVVEALEPNNRMRWGTRLQDAIAAGVAEDMGWQARRFDVYMRDEADRIGSSFDFEVEHSDLGQGLMEIKNVDWLVFRDEWIDSTSGVEAPQHIELQVQHQLEVSQRAWCAIVPLIGGNEAKPTVRMRDSSIGRDIRARVRAFWASVAAGTPPKPDYERDAEFLIRLHGRANAHVAIDADEETVALIEEYTSLGELSAKRDAIKARILERIGEAAKVRTPFGSLACGETKASPGTLITADMVGTYVGARAGFRQFRFTPKKAT